MNRIETIFNEMKQEGRKAFIGYVMTGFPGHVGAIKLAEHLLQSGADMLEIGVPFSDPLADGPVIQRCTEKALEQGAGLQSALDLATGLRKKYDQPLLLMSYLNPLLSLSRNQLVRKAVKAGIDGMIIPDLPPEEAGDWRRDFDRAGLSLVLLAAPTSDANRMKLIAGNASGFVYVVSVTGVTGERKTFDTRLANCIQQLKKYSKLPLAIGFGVSNRNTAVEAARLADGVVVASSVLKQYLAPGTIKVKEKAAVEKAVELIRAVHSQSKVEMEQNVTEITQLRERVNQLEQLAKMQSARLQVMQEVSRISTGNFSPAEMLEIFLDVVLRATDTEAGSILLLDEKNEFLVFEVTRGPKSDELRHFRVAVGEGIAGKVAESGLSMIVEQVPSDERFSSRISEEIKYVPQNILCTPLKGKNQIFGVLELINQDSNRKYTEHDRENIESLAAQIGVVLENARFFERYYEEIRRLEALTQAGEVVNSTLDLKKLLRLVMELAETTLNAEASSILLIDQETQELVFEVATGEAEDKVKEIRVPMGQGIAGHVAVTGENLLVPDVSMDDRFFKKADDKTSFKTRNIVAVPLKARGRIIGVVEALNKKGKGTFVSSDVSLLEALGNQSAVAIENAKLYQDLQNSFVATVQSLAEAVDAKDSYTAGHSSRVTEYSVLIAEELKLSEEELQTVRLSGLLHDVGKIGIQDLVLSKPGKLTDEEFAVMKQHPAIGEKIIRPVKELKAALPGILNHHERYDGRGYPCGIAGEDIPLIGRIIGVADAFDAMTSDRVYRPRLSDEVAINELKKHSGSQFDSNMVKAFLAVWQKGLISTPPSKVKL